MSVLRLCLPAFLSLALTVSSPASANDSVAAMRAGGLVLQKTDGIRMDSEDLFVSAREIRVKYRFFNHTDQDIETIVAFPLPDIDGEWEMDDTLDSTRTLPFITWADGYSVRTEIEKKATLDGADVSERLRGFGLPLEPHLASTRETLNALPEARLRQLEAAGVVKLESASDTSGRAFWVTPLWTLKTTHYWTQYFPAGRTTEIEHLYAPAIGGAAYSIVGDIREPDSEAQAVMRAKYCIEPAVETAVRRRRAAGHYFTETWIDYVLTTGANWSGPIREFRLVVDKGAPENLVSFCAEGVRRLNPTQFEVRRTNYTPDRDLEVLILTGAPQPE